jgi:hypothetical protein
MESVIAVLQPVIAIYDQFICDAISKDSVPCTQGAQHAYHNCQGLSIHKN